MTTVTRPRGPLPARVYWTRRLLLVVVAFALVFGVARLLGSGGSRRARRRTPVGADPVQLGRAGIDLACRDAAPATPTAPHRGTGEASATQAVEPTPTPLAAARRAPASDSDIVATPTVKGTAYAGQPVVLRDDARDEASRRPAPGTCPRAIAGGQGHLAAPTGSGRPRSAAARSRSSRWCVRRDQPDDGRRRPGTASAPTPTAPGRRPGPSRATTTSVAASFGAEPVDEQFELHAAGAAHDHRDADAREKPRPEGSARRALADEEARRQSRRLSRGAAALRRSARGCWTRPAGTGPRARCGPGARRRRRRPAGRRCSAESSFCRLPKWSTSRSTTVPGSRGTLASSR